MKSLKLDWFLDSLDNQDIGLGVEDIDLGVEDGH